MLTWIVSPSTVRSFVRRRETSSTTPSNSTIGIAIVSPTWYQPSMNIISPAITSIRTRWTEKPTRISRNETPAIAPKVTDAAGQLREGEDRSDDKRAVRDRGADHGDGRLPPSSIWSDSGADGRGRGLVAAVLPNEATPRATNAAARDTTHAPAKRLTMIRMVSMSGISRHVTHAAPPRRNGRWNPYEPLKDEAQTKRTGVEAVTER